MRPLLALALICSLAAAPACKKEEAPPEAAAEAPERDVIGVRTVDFAGDHDVIMAANEGRFRAIRVVVTGAPIALYKVKVTFGNGDVHLVRGAVRFEQGSMSRRIDLPGDARVIRKIEFNYRTLLTGSKKATVRVVGIR